MLCYGWWGVWVGWRCSGCSNSVTLSCVATGGVGQVSGHLSSVARLLCWHGRLAVVLSGQVGLVYRVDNLYR